MNSRRAVLAARAGQSIWLDNLSREVMQSGELAQLIQSQQLAAADLTFAAEILGNSKDHELVRTVLTPLLSHVEAVVREGAIYGLTNHLDPATRTII